MKKLIFSKAAGAVMIGLFFQSGVVHAVVQVAIGGDSPSLTIKGTYHIPLVA